MKPRRILLTGATGFVGRQVLKSLLQEDVEICCAVREGREPVLPVSPKIKPHILTKDVFKEDFAWWKNVLQGVNTIVHCAWYAEPGKYQFSPKNLECLEGTIRLARAAVEAGVGRVVGVGTCLEYQLSDHPLCVDAPLVPESPYAAAKAAAYLALCGFLPTQGIELAWCRLFYLFGEGENPLRLVPSIRTALSQGKEVALTKGTQVRDFLDVGEAGERIAKVAVGNQTGPLNICSGRALSIRGLAESIADEYGRRDLLRFGCRPDNPVDPPFVVGIPSIPQAGQTL